ncbi:MAG: lipocalin family protein [Pseudomonadota bacterium]
MRQRSDAIEGVPTVHGSRRHAATILITLCTLWLTGCVGVPDGVQAVDDFELERYLGRWYEIARLDHRFERGLTHVRAEYTLREDGSVGVVNSGYSTKRQEWKSVEGRALFVGERDVAEIKVSFFGPFFGGYNVIALDREAYAYALVCGPNRDYLWILARDPELPASVKDALVAKARELEFDVETLIWVQQDNPPALGESALPTAPAAGAYAQVSP